MPASDTVDRAPIPLLEDICRPEQTWSRIAPRYGVTAADPPWKSGLYATCECLSASGTLGTPERRDAEDQLAETTYRDVPAPERQLLALAHTMLRRGLLTEDDLARRMAAVRTRLESA